MKPLVNVDVKMPKKMLEALTLLEFYCIGKQIEEITTEFVTEFLQKHFNNKFALEFKSQYLY